MVHPGVSPFWLNLDPVAENIQRSDKAENMAYKLKATDQIDLVDSVRPMCHSRVLS